MNNKQKIRNILRHIGLYPHRIHQSRKYGFLNEIIGYLRVQRVYSEWRYKDQPRLRMLKDRHKDIERCFIIGGGPSLNKMDLTLLRNEVTFGVNGIFLIFGKMGFKPTYYVVVDNLVCEDRASIINGLNGMTKLFPLERSNAIKRDPNTIFMLQEKAKHYPGFSTDISKCIYGGSTVTYTNMQIAYYMGFKNVYLIGMDHNYVLPSQYEMDRVKNLPSEITNLEDDHNHFHPDYFGHGFRWHDPDLDKMEAAYKKAKDIFEASGRKIYNATVGGKLEIFQRTDYTTLF